MAVAFSCGSIGDILALCQIGIELGRMLDSERGSAKEYQGFRSEVDAYSEMLMQASGCPSIFHIRPTNYWVGKAR